MQRKCRVTFQLLPQKTTTENNNMLVYDSMMTCDTVKVCPRCLCNLFVFLINWFTVLSVRFSLMLSLMLVLAVLPLRPIFLFWSRRSTWWGIPVGSCCWVEDEVIVFIKSLCLPEPTFPPPDGHFTNQSSLRLMKSTFSPRVGSSLFEEKGSFVLLIMYPLMMTRAAHTGRLIVMNVRWKPTCEKVEVNAINRIKRAPVLSLCTTEHEADVRLLVFCVFCCSEYVGQFLFWLTG